MLEDIPNGGRGNMGELLSRRYDDSLDVRCEPPVSVSYGTLSLEVNHIPHPTDDMVYAQFVAGVNGKVVILHYADSVQTAHSLTDYAYPLVHIEEPTFVLVDSHGHDHFIKHRQRTLQDVEMTGRKRVKRPREQCFRFHKRFFF